MGKMPPEMMGSGEDDMRKQKLMSLQRLLENLSGIVDEDLKPDLEKIKMSMPQGEPDGDEGGMSGGEPGGLDIEIGMGGKPPMGQEESGEEMPPEEEDEEEGSMPGKKKPKGMLAILAAKSGKKGY